MKCPHGAKRAIVGAILQCQLMKQPFTHYPHIFFPCDYDKIIEYTPVLPSPPSKPTAPKEPKEDKIPLKKGCISPVVGFILLVIGIVQFIASADEKSTDKNSTILWGLIFVTLGIIGLYISYNAETKYDEEVAKLKKRFDDDKLKYSKELKQYNKELDIYRVKEQEHNEEIRKITSSDSLFEIRYQKICSLLSKLPPSSLLIDKYSSNFYKEHQIFVDDYLLKNFVVNFFSDFATVYCEKEHLFSVDIKIDFPYNTFKNGKFMPDYSRHYVSHKRLVVVFAEEQIRTHPSECIQFIKYVIKSLLLLKSINNDINNGLASVKIERRVKTYKKVEDIDEPMDDLPF